MKIKMTYEAELADVPEEVGELLTKSHRSLKKVLGDLEMSMFALSFKKDVDVRIQAQALTSVISETVKILGRLDDMAAILMDYDSVKNPPKTVVVEEIVKKPENSGEPFTDS